MPLDPGTSYNFGYISTFCRNGRGVVRVAGIYTDATTTVSITVFRTVAGGAQVGAYSFTTNSSNAAFDFDGLADGTYIVEYTSSSGGFQEKGAVISGCYIAPVDNMTITATGQNPTAFGVADGVINILVTTSNLPFKTKLNAGAFTTGKTQYTGLAAGIYTITVEDGGGFTRTTQVTLTEPAAPVPGCMDPDATNYDPTATVDNGTCLYPRPNAVFFVPIMNSLRFVKQENASVNNCSVFKTFDNTLFCRENITGIYNPGYVQKVNLCDTLTLQFRSNYQVNTVAVHEANTGNLVKTLAITLKVAQLGVHEADLICSTLDEGHYFMGISGTDDDYEPVYWQSEVFWVAENHPNTHLLTYKHSENRFDIVYATGIEHRLRVESLFYQRKPAAERSIMRGCDDKLIKLPNAKHRRRFLFQTFQLPPYLHEQLCVAFDHDQVQVNGVSFQSEETYEHEYMTRFALCNGSVLLEQESWLGVPGFAEVTGDDGYLKTETGYLKL